MTPVTWFQYVDKTLIRANGTDQTLLYPQPAIALFFQIVSDVQILCDS